MLSGEFGLHDGRLSMDYDTSCMVSTLFIQRLMSVPSIDQAEGRKISPHVVRKALENTAAPVHDVPEETLTIGRGLLQVDR